MENRRGNLIESYLYVEEYRYNNNNIYKDKYFYECRYFISYPFIGLKWFSSKPVDGNDSIPMIDSSSYGWLYGGNISVDFVKSEKQIPLSKVIFSKDNSVLQDCLYPFIIRLRCGKNHMIVRLACESESMRYKWKSEIRKAEIIHCYTHLCHQHGTIPTYSIYDFIQNFHVETLNPSFSSIPLQIIISLMTSNRFEMFNASLLRNITLSNLQLHDSHIPQISTILFASPNVSTFNISGNKFTCAGIQDIGLALCSCKYLSILDISNNLIADNGILSLSNIIVSFQSLQELNLSRNLFTFKCLKALTAAITRHSSKIKKINLSHNEIGDGAAALVALLMYFQPPLVECCDISYCGIGPLGISELCHVLPKCASIQMLKLVGNMLDLNSLIQLMDAISAHNNNFVCKVAIDIMDKKSFSVDLGGLVLVNDHVVALQGISTVLPYIDDNILLKSATLRRIIPQKYIISIQEKRKSGNQIMIDMPTFSNNCFQINFQVSSFIKNAEEFLVYLSNVLSIRSHKLSILSCTESNIINGLFNAIIMLEPYEYCLNIGSDKVISKRYSDDVSVYDKLIEIRKAAATDDVSADITLDGLSKLIQNSTQQLKVCGKPLSYDSKSSVFTPVEAEASHDMISTHFIPNLSPMHIKLSDYHSSNDLESVALSNMFESMSELKLEVSRNMTSQKRKATSKRFVTSIRQLKMENKLDSSQAKFWEGMLGNIRFQDFASKMLKLNIDKEGIFDAVGARKALCDSLFRRDIAAIQAHCTNISEINQTESLSFKLAQRFLSDISTIQLKFSIVNCTSYQTMQRIEQFLVLCANIGYSGPEMFDAIQIRQQLLEKAVALKLYSSTELDILKKNAYLTNLMLSRNIDTLKKTVESTEYSTLGDQEGTHSTDKIYVSAIKMLELYVQCEKKLNTAVKSSILSQVEDALAEAAYHNFYYPAIDDAAALIIKLGCNSQSIFSKILFGMRNGDKKVIEENVTEAKRVGFSMSAINMNIIESIIDRYQILVEKENVKADLIRTAMGLDCRVENISIEEVMSVLYKAKSLDMENDPALHDFFEIINTFLKKSNGKFNNLTKQENQVSEIIKSADPLKLESLLSHRGSLKLIIKLPTYDLLTEWMICLQEVAKGDDGIYAEQIRTSLIIKSDFFQKTARSDINLNKGWRTRYFTLSGGVLSYSSKIGGEIKGSARIIGGSVRRLGLDETGGQPFCLEVTEGRDISKIPNYLIEEAKKALIRIKHRNIENAFYDCMNDHDFVKLSQVLKDIDTYSVKVDPEIKQLAIVSLHEYELKALLDDLQETIYLVPRRRADEIISKLFKFNIDINNVDFSRAHNLVRSNEVNEHLVRCLWAIEKRNDKIFKSSFLQFTKIEQNLVSSKYHRRIADIIIRHGCSHYFYALKLGEPVNERLANMLHHSLSCCKFLKVKVDRIKTANLLLSFTSELLPDNSLWYDEYYDENKFSVDIIRKRLPKACLNGTNKGISFNEFKDSSCLNTLMEEFSIWDSVFDTFLRDSPLLSDINAVVSLILESTSDKLNNHVKNKVSANRTQVCDLVLDLLDPGSKSDRNYIDTIYVATCKTIMKQPHSGNSLRGWILLSILLHSSAPSTVVFNYLTKFIVAYQHEILKSIDTDKYYDLIDRCNNVTTYCLKLLSWTNENLIEYKEIDKDTVLCCFSDRCPDVTIYLLSGLKIEIESKYGEIDTPFSILQILCKQLIQSENDNDRCIDDFAVLAIFKGFAFYNIVDNDDVEEYDVLSSTILPNDIDFIEWHHDLAWEIVTMKTKKRIILRHRVASKSNNFDELHTILGENFTPNNIHDIKRMWITWLQQDAQLPSDHLRVETLFHEETRYVNAGMYSGSESMRVYLLAIQLLLAINFENQDNEEETLDDNNSEYADSQNSDVSDEPPKISRYNSDQFLLKKRPTAIEIDPIVAKSQRLRKTIKVLGIDCDDKLFDLIGDRIKEIELIALDHNLDIKTGRFQYFLMRSYMQYLVSWPLYGVRLKHCHLKSTKLDTPIVASITMAGLICLDPNEWTLIFYCALKDISSAKLINDDTENPMIVFTIYGNEIQLESADGLEMYEMLKASLFEILGVASIEDVASNNSNFSDILISIDSTEGIEKYLTDFYLLPTPPVPFIVRSTKYFDIMKPVNDAEENVDRSSTANTISEVLDSKQSPTIIIDTNAVSVESRENMIRCGVHGIHSKSRFVQRIPYSDDTGFNLIKQSFDNNEIDGYLKFTPIIIPLLQNNFNDVESTPFTHTSWHDSETSTSYVSIRKNKADAIDILESNDSKYKENFVYYS